MSLRLYDPFSRHFFDRVFYDRSAAPARIFDQHFGNGLFNDDLLAMPSYCPWLGGAAGGGRRRVTDLAEGLKTGLSEVKMDKDNYQVMLDVKHFKPEEVNVKTVGNSITIQGHHEEKQDDHGYVSRSFTRRYVVPDDVKVENIECNLSSDGVLSLKAPRISALTDETSRRIPIQQTGQPAQAITGGGDAATKE